MVHKRMLSKAPRRVRSLGRVRVRPDGAAAGPLRAELFGVDQLSRHAQALAERHRIQRGTAPDGLLARVMQNEKALRAFNRDTLRITESREVTPASEWLLDNFYLIEEQIQLARRHLPREYSRELPRLASGSQPGTLRVCDIAVELISHVDAQIDLAVLIGFIAAYQTVAPLKLGELWAIPIMLRLGLIENLARIAQSLAGARRDRDLAHVWVERLQAMAETNPSQIVVVVADMARSAAPISSSFVAEFCQRLSRLNPALHIARGWLEQRVLEEGATIEQLVHRESQSQASDQVSVSHSIASLRLLGAIDWKDFVENLSLVEKTLHGDPAGVYAAMDFSTRDRYRHVVETFSRNCGFTEIEVAEKAVELAAARAQEFGPTDRTAHVGYFLIDKGRPDLVRATRVRWPKRQPIERTIRRFPFIYYAGGIFLLTFCATWGSVYEAANEEIAGWPLFVCALAFALGVSQLAVSLLNWFTTLLVSPGLLPRLDYRHGIAPESASLVVVPALLRSPENIAELLETIEIHHLANRDPQLRFALLTDWDDAPAEQMPNDGALLAAARAGIESLNQKYAGRRADLFFLFHRPRRWNASENVWMGYERKRGKLMQLNAFLRGGCQDCFLDVAGDRAVFAAIKYIITLDSDTQLPREAAAKLIGTMAHPLNRPQFDARGVVTEGYGLLQPRVDINLPSTGRSWFVRLHAGEVGIDPYTRAVSDVYQDLFREGSFIGKGIYDVDAFERALEGRFPDNRILSHDLLESVYARCGLVSDVQFYEEFPTRYEVDVVRRQRWIRGDWQIARWLLPWAPGAHGLRRNPISGLSWWKIFDNLRRSLVPVALLFLLLGSWLLLPAIGDLASGVVFVIVALPGIVSVVVEAFRKPKTLPWKLHGRLTLISALRHGGQIGLNLAFLPNDALLSLGAIGRTLWRLLVTRKRLLEWRTSSDVARTARTSLLASYLSMWIAPAIAFGSAVAIGGREPELIAIALPYFALWVAAPAIAWWISQPLGLEKPDLSEEQLAFLRRTARQTWHFFETFVNAEENWLPPDNFQEEPVPTVAPRTSPTNIGLALLANLAARDFGYVSLGNLLARTEATVATLLRLARHRGHFYNWYDTHTLQPLLPLYVSMVDSGNLAGHLLTLGSGLRELADARIYDPQIFAGLRDTLQLVDEGGSGTAQLAAALATAPGTLPEAVAALERIAGLAADLPSGGEVSQVWAQNLAREAQEHLHELRAFAGASGNISLRELAAESGETGAAARARLRKIETLARQAEELAEMHYSFLYDPTRELFAIGYNVSESRRDLSFYDLLASEARLGSYVAIAQGQVRQEHWFSLGRLLVAPHGEPILVSWSGSMFEYLMPLLVMPDYPDTLLQRACAAAVRLQIEYGKSRNVPWGISESGYYLTDVQQNYQYRAFGVPGLGLKRGLAEDLVIAPYASAMALLIAPREACENLQRLAREERVGAYGFYEAIDYTPSRLPPGKTSATVRSYMAHHQGMSFLALLSLLRGQPMQKRFMARPMLKAAELLLQERLPKTEASVLPEDLEVEDARPRLRATESAMRIFQTPNTRTPEVQLLSNGQYHVAITNAGGGYSRWRDLAVTRWREDATRDDWGSFIYVRDVQTGEFWSATHQPTLRATNTYEAIFTQARAEFRERRGSLELHTELSVSPEDDVEIRRVRLTNHGGMARMVELTSYAEVVLADAAADAAHPAFSNLFVQTEFQRARSAILCTRRARTTAEKPPWLLHLLVGQGGLQGEISAETDRARFVGRAGTLVRPAALQTPGVLAGTDGSVLDPIVALRRTVVLQPNEVAVLDFITGMAEDRATADALVEKYQQSRIATRAFDLAWTHNQVTLRQLNATEAEAQLYARVAGAIIFADPARRALPGVLLDNRRGQSALWAYGISGDAPFVLLRITEREKIEIVRQLVQAHFYWRTKGLKTELVILNEDVSVYRQSLQDQITDLIAAGSEAQLLDQPGGIFVRRLEQIPNDDRVLLQSIARVVLDDENGTLLEQLERRPLLEPPVPAFAPTQPAWVDASPPLAARELTFQNGLGGFTRDGHEYVITLGPGQTTPAPWVNVLANPSLGTVVSEMGSAYSWFENAHEFRLTPWKNDPVRDTTGEAFYIRDEETGQFWSPTPGPARGATPYVIRHGFGYTVFEHTENGIASELWMYVAIDAPVKLSVFKMRNVSGQPRRISLTGYWEWVLGDLRQKTLLDVQTEVDLKTGALLARNFYNTEFPDRVVFLDVNEPDAFAHRRSAGIHRPQRHPRATGGAPARASLGQNRRWGGPVRRAPSRFRSGRGRGAGNHFPSRRGAWTPRSARSGPALPRRRGEPHDARDHARILGANVRRDQRRYARSIGQRDGQWLATLSDDRLPALGSERVLSIGRRVWFPRSTAGRDGARPCRAGADPGASVARGGSAISRRRCATLVAPAVGARGAHAFLR